MFENSEIINAMLKMLHNDILTMHLSMTASKMHEMGMIDDENYKGILSSTYKILDNQIRFFAKDIEASHPEQTT